MVNAAFPTPAILLRRFVVAGWGVSWGVLIATAITCALIQFRDASSEHPHPDLLASDYLSRYDGVFWQERYEHTWYALACVLVRWGLDRDSVLAPAGRLALPAVIAFVPVAAWVCRGVFKARREPRSLPGRGGDPGAPTLPANGPSRPECRSGSTPAPAATAGPCRGMWYRGRHPLRSTGVL